MLYQAFDSASLDLAFIEPSFLLFCKVLNGLGFDYHALFFVYSFITLVFVYLGIKNSTGHVKLSLLLYVLIPSCFLNMFVEMREVCAIAIVLYAMSSLRGKGSLSSGGSWFLVFFRCCSTTLQWCIGRYF